MVMMLSLVAHAQSYVDQELQQLIKKTILETIKPYGNDVSEASCVIMRSTGEVLADVGLGVYPKSVKEIPTLNSEAISSGVTRPVLYLALMDGNFPPDYVINTGFGEFCDSSSNCIIRDMNYAYGGWGEITIQKACDVSQVGIYMGIEIAYGKDMHTYGEALRKTGIMFTDDVYQSYSDSVWLPCEIMGAHSPFSMYQQTAWISGAVLNQGKIVLRFSDSDSPDPVCTVKSNMLALKELREAIVQAVESGSACLLRTSGLSVGAVLNVSEPDVMQCHNVTGFICLPGMDGTSGYTIGLYIRKHGSADREMIVTILRQFIDYMVAHDYIINGHVTANDDSMRPKYHVAEKGR